MHSRVEKVVLRRDQAKNSLVTEDLCIGLTKLGLRWSYRQHVRDYEWFEGDIESEGLLNLSAKHMVHRIDERGGRCRLHPVRNAGTVVVFDHFGSTIKPAQVRAINTYFQHISRAIGEANENNLKNGIVTQRSGQQPASHTTVRPTVQGFKEFWAKWKDSEELDEF